jgi:hypothetical protein
MGTRTFRFGAEKDAFRRVPTTRPRLSTISGETTPERGEML